MFTHKIVTVLLIALYALTGTLQAEEYDKTSYYVAYDKDDSKQFVLVMPSIQKAYTHEAGHIASSDLKRVDDQFVSFPTYNDGNLCFSALKSDATGANGADKMEEKCYEVNFFYTQKEVITEGVAFILFYAPSDKVYEGLAGDAESFDVVREGSVVHNENSITGDDYTNFAFNVKTGVVEGVVDKGSNTTLTSNLLVGKTFYMLDDKISRFSFTASDITQKTLFSNEDGVPSPYSIVNNEIITQDDGEEEHIAFIREESNKLLFDIGGESLVFYKTLSAFQTYLETLIESDGIKTDPDNDSVNSNVKNDGFELTSLKTEIVNNTLVIEIKAKASILNALKTTPRTGFNNILWVSISNDYEYGLLADGAYMTKDHWDINHEWQDGTDVEGYTSEVLSDGVKVTLPLSALSQEIKDLGYLNIKVETADDHYGAPGGDESQDEEHVFDTIESVVKIPTNTEETKSIVGSWYIGDASKFEYLVLLDNGKFIYAENDPAYSAPDNGLEVGNYTYDASKNTISFSIVYDDNAPGDDSGIGDIGSPITLPLSFDTSGESITVAGEIELNSASMTSSVVSGVWQRIEESTGEFEYLVLLDNGKFIYAENDPAYSAPDNGVEVGNYTYDASKNTISFSIVYDDNAPGDDSGIGDIGTAIDISVTVAGTTMTFFDMPFSKVL